MTLDDRRDRILQLSLSAVKLYGWEPPVLEQVARTHCLDTGYVRCLFPRMEDDLVVYFLSRGNRFLLEEAIKPDSFDTWRTPDKVVWAMMSRLRYDLPYKQEVKKALARVVCHQPGKLLSLNYALVDSVWRFTNDPAVDFNFYTKRLTLGAIYGTVRLHWLQDPDPESTDTERFLRAQLQLVPLLGKARQMAKEAAKVLKPLPEFLARYRGDRQASAP